MTHSISAVDLLVTLPDEYLPAPVIKLAAARDAAAEALDDFESTHVDALAPNWEARAEAADTLAAVDAVASGAAPDDVLKLPSKLDEWRSQRPKLIAIQRKLVADVRLAESRLKRAYDAVVPALLPAAHERLEAAVRSAEAAYAVFAEARETAALAMAQITHIRDRAAGGRSSAPFAGAVARADGQELLSRDPVGALRETAGTYDPAYAIRPNPLVEVIGANGSVDSMPLDRARALVGSSNNGARFADPDAVAALENS